MKQLKDIKTIRGESFEFLYRSREKVCEVLTTEMAQLRDASEEKIKAGEFGKADINVCFESTGTKVGIANFGMSTMLIENDVGVIVVAFSVFNAVVAEIRDFLQMGFTRLCDVYNATDVAIASRGKAVKLALETFQGNATDNRNDKYTSVTASVKVETKSGFEMVHVNPQRAMTAVDALLKINIYYTPLVRILAAALDMCAIGRMAGEQTIDARKKPTQLVIVGIPGLDRLKSIKLLGRQDLDVKIQWSQQIGGKTSYDRKVVGTMMGCNIVPTKDTFCFQGEKETRGEGESWKKLRFTDEDGRKHYTTFICDPWQRLRIRALHRLWAWAEDVIAIKNGADVQKLTKIGEDKEMKQIKEVKKLDAKTGIFAAIKAIGQEYQSAVSAAQEREREVKKKRELTPAQRESLMIQIGDNKKKVLDALSNKARVTFDMAEAILGEKISPEDRIRAVWAVVLENATVNGRINWQAIGTLAQNLLGEEYILWVLDALKDDPRVQHCTWDRLKPVGIATRVPIQAILSLDGKKVKLTKGEALLKGKPFLAGDEDLEGEFDIKVEKNDDGDVVIWATKDIRELIVVPKGDPTKVIVKLRQQSGDDTTKNEDIVMAAMTADTVFLFKADAKNNCVVGVRNDNTIKGVGYYNVAASAAARKLLCSDTEQFCGVQGTATYFEVLRYKDFQTGVVNNSAFLIVEGVTPALSHIRAAVQ